MAIPHIFATQPSPVNANKLDADLEYLEGLALRGDIRGFGADTDAADNSAAINSALLASANGGDAAFIPPGNWKITAPLAATLSSCMYGVGPASIINPQSVDGIVFTNQPSYQGGRFFRDFSIMGTTTTAKTAIKGSMAYASGNRVTGINFFRLNIQGFQYVADLQGFWNCRFRECFAYNNYQGVRLSEKNIDTQFADCVIQKGALTGAGDQYGILAEQSGGVRSEDIRVRGCFIYGYDYAVGVGNALFVAIEHCDFDNCQVAGVYLVTANGGTTVRDTWINTNKAAVTYGIQLPALGSANKDKVVLESNHIVCTQAFSGSVGIAIGDNQNAVTANNNRITGYETGIKNVAGDNLVCKWNSINATATAIYLDSLSANNEVGRNYIEGGTPLVFSSGTPPGLLSQA